MTVAITVDPEISVPPKYYGGIERIMDLLIRGLLGRGHQVVLFANRNSDAPCQLEAYPGQISGNNTDLVRNTLHISSRVIGYKPSLIHSLGRLAYMLPVLPRRSLLHD